MPRRRRYASGGVVFHVLNRRAGAAVLLDGEADYQAFEQILCEAHERVAMRTLAQELDADALVPARRESCGRGPTATCRSSCGGSA